MFRKISALILALALVLSSAALADTLLVLVPNDPTNEGRALLLLEAIGAIELKEGAGIEATVNDIAAKNGDFEIKEAEAAILPNLLPDASFAIINNNYALDAGLNPSSDGLYMESADSPYSNVICVREGNENSDATKALVAAFSSQAVVDFIAATWPNGDVVAVIAEPTDGFDPTVNYEALKGTTISIAVTPVPHKQVAEVAAKLLAEKGITLEIIEVTDYVTPNEFVESGDVYANYFAHIPYQENFNKENGTHLVIVAPIHVEPMAIYGGQQSDLSLLTGK
ncbi:MAG: hypothetical protein IKI84_02970 [Clostridia bacterium]|nr:hypothetical protein [Clostridia bacterium]